MKFYFQLLGIILVTFYYSILALIKLKFSRDKFIFYKLAQKWSKKLLSISKVYCEVLNKEFIVEDKYIFVSNHCSLFDIPILLSNIPLNVAIIYKKELEKIPIWGYCLKKSPFIGIVREEAKQSFEGLKQAIDLLNNGVSVLVFPEGTRSETGKLQEFKRGAFLIATQTRIPVLPITIIGSNEILPKGSKKFKSKEVKIVFHKQVLFSGLNKKESTDLINDVHTTIGAPLQTTT